MNCIRGPPDWDGTVWAEDAFFVFFFVFFCAYAGKTAIIPINRTASMFFQFFTSFLSFSFS